MGPSLTKPVMVKIAGHGGSAGFKVGVSNVNGFRSNNEDEHLALLRDDDTAFFGVFDGHSGAMCASYIRSKFEEKLALVPDWRELISPDEEKDGWKKLEGLVLACDKEWLIDKVMSPAGSTGTFFVASREKEAVGHAGGANVRLVVGNVGDSRVLLWDGTRCVSMTVDHKPENPIEEERINRNNGYVSGGRVDGTLAVSRAFGDRFFKVDNVAHANPREMKVIAVPDVTTATVPWNKGAFAVLCCDGVFESNFSNEQVIEFIRNQLTQTKDLAVIAGRVCHEAVARGSKDNVTCMIVEFADGSHLGSVSHYILPGPFDAPRDPYFREVYEKMVNSAKSGVTVEMALEMRYDELSSMRLEEGKLTEAELEELGSFVMDGEDYGAPSYLPPAEKGPHRTQWFRDFLVALKNSPVQKGNRDPLDADPLTTEDSGTESTQQSTE